MGNPMASRTHLLKHPIKISTHTAADLLTAMEIQHAGSIMAFDVQVYGYEASIVSFAPMPDGSAHPGEMIVTPLVRLVPRSEKSRHYAKVEIDG